MGFRSSVAAATVGMAAFSFVAITGPAFAECDPDEVIFEDDFEFHDVSWGQPSENVFVKDGAFVVKDGWGQVNFQTRADEADVCVDITIVEAEKVDESPTSIIFWWKDWDNYYDLKIWAMGGYRVDRYRNGRLTSITDYIETDALKQGLGQTNNFQLRLRPKDATVIANGTELIRFKGQPPQDGGVIGFQSYGLSKFDNLVVSELFE
jgi:hypothetical protein